jgi:phosphopantothenoylcysteine decarboxylase
VTRHLVLLVTGAPLAERSGDVAAALAADGWIVSASVTDAALAWVGKQRIPAVGSAAARQRGGHSDAPPDGRPDAVVVCPATFNTVGKAATGIADTYVHSVLCEAIGAAIPIVMVPMVKHSLWSHPAWQGHLDLLSSVGVWFLDPATGQDQPAPVASGTGAAIAAAFDPNWVVTSLKKRMHLLGQ